MGREKIIRAVKVEPTPSSNKQMQTQRSLPTVFPSELGQSPEALRSSPDLWQVLCWTDELSIPTQSLYICSVKRHPADLVTSEEVIDEGWLFLQVLIRIDPASSYHHG